MIAAMVVPAGSRPLRAVACGMVLAIGAGGSGCAPQNGKGEMHGSLSVPECTFPGGSSGVPRALNNSNPYQLQQTLDFFVGEPFDSPTPRFPANQLNIRMQNSSNPSTRLEFADALKFWVGDSYEVGRCMRGRMKPEDGTPDWDPTLCDRSAASLGSSGEGRLFVGTEGETVTSAFVLNNSCPNALISGVGIGACGGGSCPDTTLCPGRGSWIAFSRFGAPPADLAEALKPGFRVNNDERIEASAFHVELCDSSTVGAQQAGVVPVPTPAIVGTLDGWFGFDLQPQFR